MNGNELNRPRPGYEPEYREAAKKTDIYYYFAIGDETIRGHLNGLSPKEVVEVSNKIKKCKCGGDTKCLQTECMGEFDFFITCKSCGRSILRNCYDKLPWEEDDEVDRAISDWNSGREQEEIDQEHEKEYERKRIHKEDLIWKPYLANNMRGNPQMGYYCLVFYKNDYNDTYLGCKWMIEFQEEEIKPMCTRSDSKVEAYILFMKLYRDLDEPFSFPEPLEHMTFDMEEERRTHMDLFWDNGDFVRAYKSIEDAYIGAAGRCGWQGINRDTIIQLDNEKVQRAADLSKQLFTGKKDLAGVEYYKHPEKVASLVHSDMEKIVAYLHDVLEDTDYPEEKIREEFGDTAADAVLLLTHKGKLDKEGYLDYIRKLKKTGNAVAIKVKLADLTHNSDISRLGAKTVDDLTPKQKDRYEKYQEAIRILEDGTRRGV